MLDSRPHIPCFVYILLVPQIFLKLKHKVSRESNVEVAAATEAV